MHWKNAEDCSIAFLMSLVSLYGETLPSVCVHAIDKWMRANNAPAELVRPILDYIDADKLPSPALKHLLNMNVADVERAKALKKQLDSQTSKQMQNFTLTFKADLAIEFEAHKGLL